MHSIVNSSHRDVQGLQMASTENQVQGQKEKSHKIVMHVVQNVMVLQNRNSIPLFVHVLLVNVQCVLSVKEHQIRTN